jgi:hypothetical protein
VRQRGLGAEKRRAQVHVEGRVPDARVRVGERHGGIYRRHVDEHVEPPERRGRSVHQRAAFFGIGQVGRRDVGAMAGCPDVDRHRLGLSL